jgi:hypothetical protein
MRDLEPVRREHLVHFGVFVVAAGTKSLQLLGQGVVKLRRDWRAEARDSPVREWPFLEKS